MMKHVGSTFIYGAQRNKELYQAYLDVLARPGSIYHREAYAQAAKCPCSRYWISEERAREYIKALDAGASPESLVKGHSGCRGRSDSQTLLIRQIRSFYQVYLRMRKSHPNATLTELVYLAVSSPAPEFFITANSARIFICQYRRTMSIMERLRIHAHVNIHQ